MCGRFSQAPSARELAAQFDLVVVPEDLPPRYNVCPSQPVAAVREGEAGRRLVQLHWGLIPHWAKDAKAGYRMINAKAETLTERPAYRDAFRRRRCLIPANGFYEWRGTGTGRKQPYYIHRRDGGLLALAGLWARWRNPAGEVIDSCTIVTTDANALVAPLHDRMPVIVPPEQYGLWLDPDCTDPARLAPLLRPIDPAGLVAEPVSLAVNSPRNEGADLIRPIEPDADA
ncbi:SOS response-associated peptidase [Ectothiorhodospiraceae bacterium 2226]|nr:SOS response-associated peptidase [Ectothiorhodospiraceae bacterium 2226]